MPSDLSYVRGRGPELPRAISRMPGSRYVGRFKYVPRPELPPVSYRMYSLEKEVRSMRPSRAASFMAFASMVATLIGIAGQIVNTGSVAFAMLGAFGLATLAVIVMIYQRG